MKLENLAKLIIWVFSEMERIGTNFNKNNTQDCVFLLFKNKYHI